MQKRKDGKPSVETADAMADLFQDFDYKVELDDYLLYELGRLIEDDRASFEDEDFRRVIDEGIRQHIEESLEMRAGMAMILRKAFPRFEDAARRIASRTIRALEDVDFPLHNVSLVVRSYTAYMFRRLQDTVERAAELEEEASLLIVRWHKGEILREEMTKRLKQIGGPAVGPLGDLLFEAPDDHMAAETAIDTLAEIRTSASARVLSHAIADPILPEDIEIKTYGHARAAWPRQRHYILYTLAPHTHEDLSFRWFQLLVESDELAAVDLILDEVLVHAEDPAYTEDLKAILELLRLSHDPNVEEKLVGILNSEDTSKEAAALLEDFASRFQPSVQPAENPWTLAARLADLNKKYLGAAKQYELGKIEEASRALESILKQDPKYPFALALKYLMSS